MDDKKKSRNYFNRHSFTWVNRDGYWRHDYRATVRALKHYRSASCLDVGCGNGAFLAFLKEACPYIRPAGLDYSSSMVKKSRERLPDAEIREGDAECMPLKDHSYDAVTCHMSIHHYPHPEKALAEMYRILKPGGAVLINDLTGPDWLIRWMNRSFKTWNTGDHAIYSCAEMERMLKRAGFRNVRSELLTPFTYLAQGVKPYGDS